MPRKGHLLTEMITSISGRLNTVTIEVIDEDTIKFSFKISEVRIEEIFTLQICASLLGYNITNYNYFPTPITHRDKSNMVITLSYGK